MIGLGCLIYTGSLVSSSFATKVCHLVLSPGISFCIGFFTLYYPLLSIVDEW